MDKMLSLGDWGCVYAFFMGGRFVGHFVRHFSLGFDVCALVISS